MQLHSLSTGLTGCRQRICIVLGDYENSCLLSVTYMRQQPMSPVVDEVVDTTCDVDNQKKIVGARLKEARIALGMTQKQMVLASGIPLPSLRDYEGGKRMPGGDAIASLLGVGINANWLLTGHGPMLWKDLLAEAKRVRGASIESVNDARRKIVTYAMGRVRTRWFVTSPGEAGHALNPVVDDYNAGRIFQFDKIRDEIPSITVEELMKWGRDAMRRLDSQEDIFVGDQPYKTADSTPVQCFQPIAGYVAVPLYNDVRAAAGHGALVEHENADDALMFKEDWLRFELGAKASDLCLIRVSGDSMEPTLRGGDVILVNQQITRPDREGIYILRMGEMLLVKRLQAVPGGNLRVISDNAAFDSWVISLADLGVEIAIIGRVVWSGRKM